jgi:fructokinase
MKDSHLTKGTVFAFGETVLDLVSEGGFTLQAVPGGSVLNASVSLGRMDVDIQLISEFGADKAGNLIGGFLEANSVQTDFCIRYPDNKTSLALAFLDEAKNASYSFYHDTPEKITGAKIPFFQDKDILLFGSFYAVKPGRRAFVSNVIKHAAAARSVIYYDLNIRKAHAKEMDSLIPSFIENMASATIVKGSDEDFYHLFGMTDPNAVYEKVRQYCKILILTAGAKPVHIFTPNFNKAYDIKAIVPVSTIGAGDNFNAGFIYGLYTSGFDALRINDVAGSEIDRMAGCGLAFATEACLSAENYIHGNFEPDFWERYI